jgi:hypothetical protein
MMSLIPPLLTDTWSWVNLRQISIALKMGLKGEEKAHTRDNACKNNSPQKL